MRQFKLELIDPMTDVTFLYPNKKVTKEIGIGGSFLQRRPLLCTTPPKQARPAESLLSAQVSRLAHCRITSEPSLHGKNRNIFVVHRM